MAALPGNRIRQITVPGVEWIDRGYATEDFIAGDLVIVSPTPSPSGEFDMLVVKATGTKVIGMVVQDCEATGLVSFALLGEASGYTGLTPGAEYTVVGGDLDTTAPDNAAGTFKKAVARNAHSVWFNFMTP